MRVREPVALADAASAAALSPGRFRHLFVQETGHIRHSRAGGNPERPLLLECPGFPPTRTAVRGKSDAAR